MCSVWVFCEIVFFVIRNECLFVFDFNEYACFLHYKWPFEDQELPSNQSNEENFEIKLDQMMKLEKNHKNKTSNKKKTVLFRFSYLDFVFDDFDIAHTQYVNSSQ